MPWHDVHARFTQRLASASVKNVVTSWATYDARERGFARGNQTASPASRASTTAIGGAAATSTLSLPGQWRIPPGRGLERVVGVVIDAVQLVQLGEETFRTSPCVGNHLRRVARPASCAETDAAEANTTAPITSAAPANEPLARMR
jgi:hypothetical protein